MSLVIVSDPHIGEYSYGRTDPTTGLNTRLLDLLNNFDQTITYAIDVKAAAYIIVGDIYRVKHPNSKIRKQFASKLKRLIKANILVILMTGNHDMTATSDGAHAMSEMEELSDLIDNLTIVSSPQIIPVNDDELYLLPFVNRGEQGLLTPQEFLEYQRKCIDDFNLKTNKSRFKNKLFFGHFGTDKSVIGNSFDLDMSDNEHENKVSLSAFDGGDWTKVYLGHIHKQQEFNKIARHVGSLCRVDFTEEKEQKGFYHYNKGLDQFIHLDDRQFLTLELKLLDENYKTTLVDFQTMLNDLNDNDKLKTAIVKLKVDVLQTYYTAIKLDRIESFLRENCWHFTGASINVSSKEVIDDNVSKITNIDAPDEALKKFVDKHSDRFKDIKDKMVDKGIDILKQVKSFRS